VIEFQYYKFDDTQHLKAKDNNISPPGVNMGQNNFSITFWGVRGGYPKPGPTTVKYGGNTTCFEVRAGKHRIIIDGGTGIIALGAKMMRELAATEVPLRATILVTHTHHDHTQGFPFFVPTRHHANYFDIFGPELLVTREPFEEFLERVMQPPVFPIGIEELYCQRRTERTKHGDTIVLLDAQHPAIRCGVGQPLPELNAESVTIKVNHGYNHPKNGVLFFRITYQGRSLVIATDTEGYTGNDQKLIHFSQDVDMLVHDAEYDIDEYAKKGIVRQGWGHSTWRMAVNVAAAANAKTLVLTHHSPGHDDAYLESMLAKVQTVFPNSCLAREGLTLTI